MVKILLRDVAAELERVGREQTEIGRGRRRRPKPRERAAEGQCAADTQASNGTGHGPRGRETGLKYWTLTGVSGAAGATLAVARDQLFSDHPPDGHKS